MTKEDIDIKSKLDSIAWTVFRINRETNNTALFQVGKYRIGIYYYESRKIGNAVFTWGFTYNETHSAIIQKLTDCEKRLLFELRRANQNTRRTI